MAKDSTKRQMKLMKKRQKDKARQRKQANNIPFGLLSARKKILLARNFPFYECLINPLWQEEGLATILISRRQPDDKLIFAVYLMDIYCLGLKNTFCNADFSLSRYKHELLSKIYQEKKPVSCPVPLAHQIIYGGIDFAMQLGFKPNKDFKLSQYVLEARDNFESSEVVEFGKDGKPLFIAGLDDNVEHIIRQLDARVGRKNFEYICEVDDPTFSVES